MENSRQFLLLRTDISQKTLLLGAPDVLCIFIVIPLVISVLAINLYKYVCNTENMKIKPFYHDLGVGKKLTEEKWHKFNSDLYLPYEIGYGICRKVNSKRQAFSSHILNKTYQISCPWKTQKQHSSWDEKLFAT